ncbi:MAG: TetR/AcrR family transcriptional regulator [Myxococcota bacterium]
MDTRTQILDVGEALMKRAGYSGFSYADVSKEVGIRKASIHHHFPNKSALARAALERYREASQARLAASFDPQSGVQGAAQSLGQMFVDAFEGPGNGCLCGSLAAEWELLPDELREHVRAYWNETTAWMAAAIMRADPAVVHEHATSRARLVVSLLEGAMMSARVMGSTAPLHEATATARLLASHAHA